MNIEEFHTYCMAKNGTEECFPFDEHTLVFKVAGKMYALTNLTWEVFSVNLKCEPERAEELRDQYDEVEPGYHMSKKHWNTISFDGDLDADMLTELIDHSYDLVKKSLPKKVQKELDATM